MATNSNSALPTYGEVQTMLTPINDEITNLNNDTFLKSNMSTMFVNDSFNLISLGTGVACGTVSITYNIPYIGTGDTFTFSFRFYNSLNKMGWSFTTPPYYVLLGKTITYNLPLQNGTDGSVIIFPLRIHFSPTYTLFIIKEPTDTPPSGQLDTYWSTLGTIEISIFD